MVETVKTVTVVHHHRVEVPLPLQPSTIPEFVDVLTDLTRRLDAGRIYDRDLPTLTTALRAAVEALARREKAASRPLW